MLFAVVIAARADDISIHMPTMAKTTVKPPTVAKKEDVFLESDNMYYDTENQLVIASGKVEILKGDTVLFADHVTYDQLHDVITATGNVVTVNGDNDAVFSDKAVLKDDFATGVSNYFRVRLNDGSLIAAQTARETNSNKVVMRNMVYSPCPLCADDPTAPLQWQIKAKKATLDNVDQSVTYHDATFEAYGVPVMYTPWFSHGLPNSPPESGFLTPLFRTDKVLGATTTIPYYWHISQDMDATIEPMITTGEGPVLAGQFRHLTPYGQYEFFGSYTRPYDINSEDNLNNDIKDWRGHIKGDGKFNVTDTWDVGFDGEAASDDTYLHRYNYEHTDLPLSNAYSSDLLTSHVYAERFDDRDYTSIQAVHFQSLVAGDDAKTIPLAAPYVQNHFESSKGVIPGFANSVLWTDVSGFAIERDLGSDNQRVSATGGLTIPVTTPGGNLFKFDVSLRGDQYFMQNDPTDGNQAQRVIPETSLEWRYPLVNPVSPTAKVELEPIVKLVASPNLNYNKNIPNEDSQDVEFSDLNVFEDSKFRGIDQVDSGARVYYGLRGGYYEQHYNVNYLVGQNYRLDKPKVVIPVDSGIDDRLSDYVGRVTFSLYDKIDLSYKFRMNPDNFRLSRSEVQANVNWKPVKLTLDYFKLDYDFTDPTNNREEISGLVQYYVSDKWSVLAGGDRNLEQNQNITAEGGVLFEGDCTNILTSVKHSFLTGQEGTSVNVQIGLKNLGVGEL